MGIIRKRVFITVKTYPNPSASYVETVCTAGIVENEGWIRLYPVPYRVSSGLADKQFKKYQWIDVDVVKRPPSSSDKRPESYSPQEGSMKLGKIIPPTSSEARKDIIFRNTRKFRDFDTVFSLAKDFKISLATFEPSEIVKFYAVPCEERDWTEKEQAKLDKEIKQKDFFIEDSFKRSNLQKVPYEFRFTLKDSKGKLSDMMIEDWEVGACYWNMLERSHTEKEAVEKVIACYNKICTEQDCIFFMGTTNQFHNRKAPNPFVIIGLFHTPKTSQVLLNF